MATSKIIAKSIVKGSEETFDNCCSPCTEAGKTKEAKNFCVECESSFCEDCLLDHNKFPSLRSHQILDRSGMVKGNQREAEVALPTERCAIHHGKLIDMFCGDHDEVCCAACIAIKHRGCVNIEYLPDIAQSKQNSTEIKETLHSLETVLARLKKERENWKGNFDGVGKEKYHLLKEVEKYESELIQKIKELAKVAKEQICSKHEEYKKAIQSNIDRLETVISTMTTSVKKCCSENEIQLFANAKNSKKLIKDCEILVREMPFEIIRKELKFKLNVGLTNFLTTLGSVNEDINEYMATLYGKFNVSSGHNCQVTGACAMDDGTYLISDYDNAQLKKLDGEFNVVQQIVVASRPYPFFKVGTNVAAVILYDGTVQFVSTEQNMTLTTSFRTDGILNSVSSTDRDELFIFKGDNKVSVYEKEGAMLRTYTNNDIGGHTIIEPKQAAISSDNKTIFVANDKQGLLALDREGRTLWTFSDPEMEIAWGVCVLPGDIILVSGLRSNTILQVDKHGKKIGMLLGPSENLLKPFALAFDRITSRLLVGCGTNEVHVYTLSMKM